jgi:hypothetical protein
MTEARDTIKPMISSDEALYAEPGPLVSYENGERIPYGRLERKAAKLRAEGATYEAIAAELSKGIVGNREAYTFVESGVG